MTISIQLGVALRFGIECRFGFGVLPSRAPGDGTCRRREPGERERCCGATGTVGYDSGCGVAGGGAAAVTGAVVLGLAGDAGAGAAAGEVAGAA